jgi:uncharacterized protein YggE
MRIAFCTLALLPLSLFAQAGLPSQPYLYVEGKAELERSADIATLKFDVVERDSDRPKANQKVQAAATKVLTLLNEHKVPEKDVIAQDLRPEPEYDGGEDVGRSHRKVIGYSATRSFVVKLRDLGALSKLVNDLVAVGTVEFTSIEAGLADQRPDQEEVSKKALINARDQAEKALKSVGMKIDSVYAISPVPFPSIQQQIFSSRTSGVAGYEVERHMIEPSPLEYRLSPIAISESVHVIYLISAAK